MEQPQIKIYIGQIEQWAKLCNAEERAESICGRLLLLYGLLQQKEEYERFMADTLTAVSYTHLDVYKRQSEDFNCKSRGDCSAHYSCLQRVGNQNGGSIF